VADLTLKEKDVKIKEMLVKSQKEEKDKNQQVESQLLDRLASATPENS